MVCKHCGLPIHKNYIFNEVYNTWYEHDLSNFSTCAYAHDVGNEYTKEWGIYVRPDGQPMVAEPLDSDQTEPLVKPKSKPFLVTKQLPVKPKKSRAPRKKKFVLPAVVGRKFRGA